MKIKLNIDLKYLLLSLSMLTAGMLTANGFLQKHIYFADPLNEFAFFALCVGFGGILLPFSFQKSK